MTELQSGRPAPCIQTMILNLLIGKLLTCVLLSYAAGQIGFMVIDALAKSEGVDMRKLEKSAAVGKMELQGKQIILAKPVTFMNNSGESVAALAKFYKVSCCVLAGPEACSQRQKLTSHNKHGDISLPAIATRLVAHLLRCPCLPHCS